MDKFSLSALFMGTEANPFINPDAVKGKPFCRSFY